MELILVLTIDKLIATFIPLCIYAFICLIKYLFDLFVYFSDHTYIHTYIRTYVRTYVHTYIHEHAYTDTYIYISFGSACSAYSTSFYCIFMFRFASPNGLSGHVFVDMIGSPAEGATKPSVHVERAMSGQLRCCYWTPWKMFSLCYLAINASMEDK